MIFTQETVDAVLDVFRKRTGIVIPTSRTADVAAGIERAMARVKNSNLPRFLERLAEEGEALDALVAELAVGETYFFRDSAHFDEVRSRILPAFRQNAPDETPFRAWSAGCSSGEEAYSLAILLEEERLAGGAEILATDICRNALSKARAATYGPWSFRGCEARLESYVTPHGSRFHLAERFRSRVKFQHLNLVDESYPSSARGIERFDLILCRNVLIYFESQTAHDVVRRLIECLNPGGWLIIGPSDPPLWNFPSLEAVATSAGMIYRHVAGRPARMQPAAPSKGPTSTADRRRPQKRTPPHPRPVPKRHALAPPEPAEDVQQVYDRGDYERVMALTRGAGLSAEDHALRIQACANLGKSADALAASVAAVSAHPLSSALHFLHAVSLLGCECHAESLEALRRVLYLDPDQVVARLVMAGIYWKLGQVEVARRIYYKALAICSQYPADRLLPFAEGNTAQQLAAAAKSHLRLLDTMKGAGRGA